MRVEACCQSLLNAILPAVDPDREGVCVDVGVGDFAFYCRLFSQLGFKTVAVEPSPHQKLRKICDRHSIDLLECCLSDHNGTQRLHLGKFARLINRNFNSLESEWFASSRETKLVSTISLLELMRLAAVSQMTNGQPQASSSYGGVRLTCLKLDVEGWEVVIIKQLKLLPLSQLPKIIMFEYGGGSRRSLEKKGWSDKFLGGTMTSLETLQKCGYGFSIMIDYAPDARTKIFDLQSVSLDPDLIFPPNAVYGNIISFRGCDYPESAIAEITSPYNGKWLNWLMEKFATS